MCVKTKKKYNNHDVLHGVKTRKSLVKGQQFSMCCPIATNFVRTKHRNQTKKQSDPKSTPYPFKDMTEKQEKNKAAAWLEPLLIRWLLGFPRAATDDGRR